MVAGLFETWPRGENGDTLERQGKADHHERTPENSGQPTNRGVV